MAARETETGCFLFREAWGEFIIPRENDTNKMAENEHKWGQIGELSRLFRSTPVHSEGTGNM